MGNGIGVCVQIGSEMNDVQYGKLGNILNFGLLNAIKNKNTIGRAIWY